MRNNPLKVKIYNVGHGDCILITFPNSEIALIDSQIPKGETQIPPLELIKKKGRLKFVCLTHPHLDHFNGMLSIFKDKKIKVEKFYHSINIGLDKVLKFINEYTAGLNTIEFISLKDWGDKKKKIGEILDIFDFVFDQHSDFHERISERKDFEDIAGVKMYALAPSSSKINTYDKMVSRLLDEDGKKPSISKVKRIRDYANKISAVVHLTYGENKLVFGGDAMDTNWNDILKVNKFRILKLLPANILKASHHGSETSFAQGMWNQIIEQDGIIAVSSGKPHHPHEKFVSDLKGNGVNIYCTNLGDYCNNNNKSQKTSDPGFYTESEEDDRICCDWIEILVYKGNSEPKIQFGNPNCFRYCKYKQKSTYSK